MKKGFKIAICALLILCGSFAFAACGKKQKVFKESKISFVEDEVVYDREGHIFKVSYSGLEDDDLTISYAVEENGEIGKYTEDLSFVQAGSYKVYYKLSAKGYKDYKSSEPKTFTITKRPVTLSVSEDQTWVKKNGWVSLTSQNLLVEDNDELKWEFTSANEVVETLTPGQTVTATLKASQYFNDNYQLEGELPSKEVLVVDNFAVKKGESVEYKENFEEALALLNEENAELHLYQDVVVDKSLTFTNSVKIVGHGSERTITANPGFNIEQGKELIHFDASGKTLTLEGVVLDGNYCVACVYAKDATLVLNDGVEVKNGCAILTGDEADVKDKLTGGVRVEGDSNFTLNGGRIYNNQNGYEETTEILGENNVYEYARNLWIGVGVKATISSGSSNNVWVDASEDASKAAKLTIEEAEEKSAVVPEVFLASCSNAEKNAQFEYKSGSVNNVCVSNGKEIVQLPVFNGLTYHANDLFQVEDLTDGEQHTFYSSFEQALSAVKDNETLILYTDVETNSKFDITKNFTLEGNGHTIKASQSFATADVGGKTLKTMFYLPQQSAVQSFNINNLKLDGNGVARPISCFGGYILLDNVTVTNGANEDNFRASGIFMSGKSSANLENCQIINNPSTGADAESEEYYIEADLWVGANVTVTVGNNTTVDYTYVNANSFSAENEGYLLVNDGTINHIWLEYDGGFGAELLFQGGTISSLKVDQADGSCLSIVPEAGNNYKGGVNGAVQPQED